MTDSPGDEGGWLSAAEALSLVSEAMGPYQAPRAIASRAHDGLVRSRAKRFIRHQQTLSDVDLPSEFWWAGGEAALKQNWTSGDFSTWIDQLWHWNAYGVAFHRADIEGMLPRKEQCLSAHATGQLCSVRDVLPRIAVSTGLPQRSRRAIDSEGLPRRLSFQRAARAFSALYVTATAKVRLRIWHVAVPLWFWEGCLDGPDAILNWKSGRFAGSGDVDDNSYKAIISGLEFQVGAIVELEGIEVTPGDGSAATPSAEQPQGRIATAGRKRSDQWQAWVAELVAHIHNQGIPEGIGSQGQEELIRTIADALAKRGEETLSRSTVQPVVQSVLDRLRSAEN